MAARASGTGERREGGNQDPAGLRGTKAQSPTARPFPALPRQFSPAVASPQLGFYPSPSRPALFCYIPQSRTTLHSVSLSPNLSASFRRRTFLQRRTAWRGVAWRLLLEIPAHDPWRRFPKQKRGVSSTSYVGDETNCKYRHCRHTTPSCPPKQRSSRTSAQERQLRRLSRHLQPRQRCSHPRRRTPLCRRRHQLLRGKKRPC